MKNRHLLLAVMALILVMLPFQLSAKPPKKTMNTNNGTPDFAYPETVMKQSRGALDRSLKAGDDPATLRALMDYAIAGELKDQESLPGSIALIDSVKSHTASPQLRAMLNALTARIYTDIYEGNRYVYDRRELPLTPRDADYNKWSGKQFQAAIMELTEASLADEPSLKSTPLNLYASSVTHDAHTWIYYPTLYDFLAQTAIRRYMDFAPTESVFTAGLLSPWTLYVTMPFNYYSPTAQKILSLYASLLTFHANDIPALINVDIQRIKFVGDHLFGNDDETQPVIKALQELYQRYADSEYSGDILLCNEFTNFTNPDYDNWYKKLARWYYTSLTNNLSKFRNYWANDFLDTRLKSISSESAKLKSPDIVRPGAPLKIEARMANVNDLLIEVYDASEWNPTLKEHFEGKNYVKPANLLATLHLTSSAEKPFVENKSIEYVFEKPGYYMLVPVIGDKRDIDGRYISVTRLALMTTQFFTESDLYVLDPFDGTAVSGANVKFKKSESYRNKTKYEQFGTTGKNGSIFIPEPKGNFSGTFFAQKGKDRFAEEIDYQWSNYNPYNEYVTAANIFTDLAIYRPGDTVNWAAVAYEIKNNNTHPLKDLNLQAMLYDANGNSVDTVSVVTDKWGRVSGSLSIPKGSLTGYYRIDLISGKLNSGRVYGSSFMVSDYKLPTFAVKMSRAEMDAPAKGAVTLRGNVMTYSGMPLADSKVEMTLSVAQFSRFFFFRPSGGTKFYDASATTDAKGNFEIVVPAEVFEHSPCPAGYFTANVAVTSQSGESHDASVSFALSRKYNLEVAAIPQAVNAAEPLKAEVKVTDFEGKSVSQPVRYSINRNDSVITAGLLPADGLIAIDKIPSGKYDLLFCLSDSALANEYKTEIVLYRTDDKTSPVPDQFIWSTNPDSKFRLGADRKLSWLFASNCKGRLLVIINAGEKEIFRKWVDVSEGMNRFNYSLPVDVNEANMSVVGMGNYQTYEATFNITAPEARVTLQIKTESFRDKVVPGTEETWTFSVVDSDGKPQDAAVLMDMYNMALDALRHQPWKMHVRKIDMPKPYFSLDKPGTYRTSVSKGYRQNYFNGIGEIPEFQTYDHSFSEERYYKLSRIRMRGVNSLSASADMAEEEVESDEVPMASAGAAIDAGDYEVKVIGYGTMLVRKEKKADEKAETAAEPFAFRDREVALALFRPMLNTDRDGRLTLKFRVPNANTTWRLRALAYNEKMKAAGFNASVLASKPVMVQPNLPRFIRTGDDATVKALVMNNSDSTQTVTTVTELFDPSTGKVFASKESVDTIAASASATVEMNIKAGTDMPFIGYRVKSSTATFADGEQSLLPVLPSSTPVIETRPFYLAPDSLGYAMTLPDFTKGARLTLQFCENPAWYVVTALPVMLKKDASTANEAAASIYSASIARGILADNPAIEKALKEWTASEKSDSMLTSMLERNSDLKIMLLNATPWMMDARSDTERMTRLSLLFDRKEIESVLSANFDLLSRLERDGGGWAWMGQFNEASEWATTSVLLMMGDLKKLGYLPSDKKFAAQIDAAIDYIDKETLADYKRFPEGDYRLYTYLRSLYPENNLSTSCKAITTATVNRILRNWKNHGVFDKAVDALILNRYSYPSVAKTVLASLREYSKYEPEKGMWWPSLDNMTVWSMDKLGTIAYVLKAFAEIEPTSADIDRIRQWLILQKEAMDWGSSVTAIELVNAILRSSSRWIQPAQGVEIAIGDRKVTPESIDRITGYFRTDVSSIATPGARLTIDRSSDTPAWGAFYAQFTAGMTDVKAASIPDLKITKRVLRYEGTEVVPATEMKVGDKVRVELTIEAGRDMDYVAVNDDRPACFEPVEQLPKPIFSEGICFYRENLDSKSRIFVSYLPKGTYLLTYDMWVNNAGEFTSGIATIQSQYAPQLTAHSAGERMTVKPQD